MRGAILFVLVSVALAAADAPWPLEVTRLGGVATIYQPQPERLQGNTLMLPRFGGVGV